MKTAQTTAHTPGPWRMEPHNDLHPFAVWSPNSAAPIALVCQSAIRAEAHARLIAAAPELFELVKSYRDQLDEVGMTDGPTFRKLCALIEKVEGDA